MRRTRRTHALRRRPDLERATATDPLRHSMSPFRTATGHWARTGEHSIGHAVPLTHTTRHLGSFHPRLSPSPTTAPQAIGRSGSFLENPHGRPPFVLECVASRSPPAPAASRLARPAAFRLGPRPAYRCTLRGVGAFSRPIRR